MVFRRRFRNAIRPVKRIKHVVDFQGGSALGINTVQTLIVENANPTTAATSQVETGATVNGIYLRVEVVNDGATGVLPNVYMAISKNPGNNLTIVNPNVIGSSNDKRWTIHQSMVMLQAVENSNPRTLFDGVIVIPRGYRRFAPDDRLQINLFSPGIAFNFCIQCHYKEYQ